MLVDPTTVSHVGQLQSRRTLAWRRKDAGMSGCHLMMGEGLLSMGEGNGQCYSEWNQREEIEGWVEESGSDAQIHLRNF